jgi:hypothetical protein
MPVGYLAFGHSPISNINVQPTPMTMWIYFLGWVWFALVCGWHGRAIIACLFTCFINQFCLPCLAVLPTYQTSNDDNHQPYTGKLKTLSGLMLAYGTKVLPRNR